MAMFRAGNAFSKKQPAPTAAPAPAPAASRRPFGGSAMPSMSRAKAPVAAPTTRGVPTDNYGNLYVGSRRRQSAPVAPAPAKTYNETQLAELRKADQALGNVAKSTYSPADLARIQQEQSKAMLQQPQQASGLKAIGRQATPDVVAAPTTPQPRMTNDIVSQNDAKGNAMMKQASMAANERFLEKQAQKARVTPAPVSQVPTPPPFRKGGAVKKKPGYAKGGMAMCGASMPPAQKRKK